MIPSNIINSSIYDSYKNFENKINIEKYERNCLVEGRSCLVDFVNFVSVSDFKKLSLYITPKEMLNLSTFHEYASSPDITLDIFKNLSLGYESVIVKHPLSSDKVISQHCVQLDIGTFLRFENNYSTFYLFQYNFTCEGIFFPEKKLFIYFSQLQNVEYHLNRFFSRLIEHLELYGEYFNSDVTFGGVKFEHPSPFHYYCFKVSSFYKALSLYPSLSLPVTTTPVRGGFFDAKMLFGSVVDSNVFKGGSGKKNGKAVPYECLHNQFFVTFGDRWEELSNENDLQLDDFIAEKLNNNCSINPIFEAALKVRDFCDIFIWLGVTSGKRSWLEESEAYIKLINNFIAEGKNVGVIFDGWTSTLTHSNVSKNNELYRGDNKLMQDVVAGVSSQDKFMSISTIGATAHEKICAGNMVDFFIGNHSTGSLWISRICKKVGITHTSNITYGHALKVNKHFKSFLIPKCMITDSKVEEGVNHYKVSYSIKSDEFVGFALLNLNNEGCI